MTKSILQTALYPVLCRFSWVLMLLIPTLARAQSYPPVTTAPSIVFKELKAIPTDGGRSLDVSFVVEYASDLIAPDEALLITPIYQSPEGTETRLPHIRIDGRHQRPYYDRETRFFPAESYHLLTPLVRVTLDPSRDGKPGRLSYSYRLTPQEPVRGGALTLEQVVEDCCDYTLVGTESFPISGEVAEKSPADAPGTPPAPEVTPAIYEANVTFIEPPKEEVKQREVRTTVRIKYPVDKHDVRPYFADNDRELRLLEEHLRPVMEGGNDYRIERATILGYASPEAPYQYNLALSERRAEGFRRYLEQRYGARRIPYFEVRGMGEDWEGLRRLVADSYLPERSRILEIIDRYGIFEGRERHLMELNGGATYKELLHNLFPALRRMDLTLEYVVRPFSTSESEALIKRRPQDLSQREIYDVARSRNSDTVIRSDRKTYGTQYDVAASYFGDDAIANINAAGAALIRGDLDKAWQYLSRVQTNPRAYNNLGVYYWMRGDRKRASEYFLNVPPEDAAIADRNLREMNRHNP